MADVNLHHRLMFLIGKSRGEVKVSDAAKVLGLDENSLLDMVGVLCEHKIVDVVYTVSEGIVLKPGEKFKASLEEISKFGEFSYGVGKAEARVTSEKGFVDGFLSSVRKEIAVKKAREIHSQ